MTERSHQVVIVGGGIVGSSLAVVLADGGLDVLLLERQPRYRDRVRGEALAPWGLLEARELGLADLLIEHGAVLDRVYAFDELVDAATVVAAPADLDGLFDGVPGMLGIGHPRFTEVVSDTAAAAGATVERGVTVTSVEPGRVVYERDGDERTVTTDLVVGADGRDSRVRTVVGEPLHRSGPVSRCSGLLVEGLGPDVPRDAITTEVRDPRSSIVFPQGDGRARLYHITAETAPHRYRGAGREARFVADFASEGLPWGDGVAAATPAGPCATFPILDTWTDRPVRDGVVLVGDAAGASNPLCAQGMSVCLRDVRLVRDVLLGGGRWDEAAFGPYVADRAERMARLRAVARFFTPYSVPGTIPASERAVLHDRVHRDTETAAILSPLHLGPYAAPAHVFDPRWVADVTGVDVATAA